VITPGKRRLISSPYVLSVMWKTLESNKSHTPKHTSWMNQIELWFSILVRKLLRRASFTSVEDLQPRVFAFVAYFKRNLKN